MDGMPKLSSGNDERPLRKNSSAGSATADKMKLLDITRDRPTKVAVKVMVPVRDHPRFNFVGKLLGPKGNSMKRLQEETMCKMVVLGRGSMKDRKKEDELRKSSDPRYAHLSQDLHIEISTFAPPAEAHARVAYALAEVRRFLVPDNYDDIRQEQKLEMEALNSSPGQMQSDDHTSSSDASDTMQGNEGSILGSDSFLKDSDACLKAGKNDMDKSGNFAKCIDNDVERRNQINLQSNSIHPTAMAAALQQQLASTGIGFMKPITGIAPLAGVLPAQGVIGIPSEADLAMPALTLLKAPDGILPAARGISAVNIGFFSVFVIDRNSLGWSRIVDNRLRPSINKCFEEFDEYHDYLRGGGYNCNSNAPSQEHEKDYPRTFLSVTNVLKKPACTGNFGRKRPLHSISDKNPMKRSVMTLLARARTSQALHAARHLNTVEIANRPIQVASTSPYII